MKLPRRLPARAALAAAVLAPCGAALLFPAIAAAHGIVGRADLPIPVWLFSWAAGIVLVVSFVALSALWTRPQLQTERREPLLHLPRAVEVLASLAGVGLFALVLYSGFAGTQVWSANFSVTFIYVIFWIGMPVASVLLGDIFSVLSPWRSCARAIRGLGARLAPKAFSRPPLRYPERLGQWPAVALLVGFAWLELVVRGTRQPVDPRGPLARLLPADARRHACLRGGDVGHERGRLRRLLRTALEDVAR